MQHSSAGAATTAAVPAIAALPLLQLQTAQPGFPTASAGTAFLLHDVQSLQQTVLPLHLGGSSGSSGGAGTESEQMELDKRAIHRHPLFPLLASLFEKCEKATANVDGQVTNESFNADIEVFVRNQEAERKPFFSDDPEVDNLMVKAIQVLRIHLLELEKVNELCKDFCARYISCLRGKLSSGSLLKSDSSSDTEDSECHANGSALDATGGSSAAAAMCLGQGAQLVSGGTVFQMVQTSHGLVAQPLQIQAGPAILHGSTGAGVGGPAAAAAMQLAHFSLAGPGTAAAAVSGAHSPLIPGSLTAEQQTLALASLAAMDEDDDDDELNVGDNVVRSIGGTGGRGGKSKRGVLPKQATLIMKSWLFQHIVHPYPTEDEKRQIASQTNLTLLQVNNWFINARRRILQPMLDASNPDQSKSRKSKSHGGGGRPMQRFWPESMASLQSQHGGGGAGSSGASDSGAPSASASLLVAANSITVKPSDMQLFKCRMSASASTVGSSGGSALHPLGPGVLLYSGDHVEGIGLHELSGDSQRQPPLSRSVESGADDGGSSSSDAGLSE